MTKGRDEIIQNRKRLKRQFGLLFTEVEQILIKHDPIGIAYVDDEYSPEVGTILPRLGDANTATDVTDIVYEEFVRWFDDEKTVGPKAKYHALSADIWAAWNRFKSEQH